MGRWAVGLVCCLGALVFAGKDTDEDLAHYIKKEPSTDMPWTSNERRINKMIEEEIIKFNYAPETTECPFDSQGKPKPTEGRQPTWWNAYRQAKEGDRPDWSAEIKELIKNPRTYPPWTPSQESEPLLSKFKNIEPFTWRPGAPVINLRIKTDATTRSPEPQEPTTERSMVLSYAHWETSEGVDGGGGGGGGGKEPPLNLAPLQKGYREDTEYLKVKLRKRPRKVNMKKNLVNIPPLNSESGKRFTKKMQHQKHMKTLLEEDRNKRKLQAKQRSRNNAHQLNLARI